MRTTEETIYDRCAAFATIKRMLEEACQTAGCEREPELCLAIRKALRKAEVVSAKWNRAYQTGKMPRV